MKFHISQLFKPLAACSACEHGCSLDDTGLTCGYNNSKFNIFNEMAACPIGKWKRSDNAYVHVPDIKPFKFKELWEKAHSLLTAISSGKTDEVTLSKRQSLCQACPQRYKGKDGHYYCGACGCGEWSPARLDNKLKWDKLKCPLEKW